MRRRGVGDLAVDEERTPAGAGLRTVAVVSQVGHSLDTDVPSSPLLSSK